jgi:hypothetical protein
VEGAGDFIDGRGSGGNLQKTKDIVGIEVRGSGHGVDCARWGANFPLGFYAFFRETRNFFVVWRV